MPDTHSGINLCANTLNTIDDYDIRDRVGYFILDNTSSNDVAVNELSRELGLNSRWRRLRCAGHIINLIARQALFGEDYEMFDA